MYVFVRFVLCYLYVSSSGSLNKNVVTVTNKAFRQYVDVTKKIGVGVTLGWGDIGPPWVSYCPPPQVFSQSLEKWKGLIDTKFCNQVVHIHWHHSKNFIKIEDIFIPKFSKFFLG